ncbi:MAG: DUF6602 domain-containing protein [Rhodococcus sp. (in: high G+C Gram-positive bacteria)]
MQAILDATRAGTRHPTTVGDSAERAVRDALRAHLPAGLRVGHGHVHDSFDNESKQADVVITNSDHPFTSLNPEEADQFFLEGVSTVGEVKATFGTTELAKTIEAGSRLKQLCPMFHPKDQVLNSTQYTKDTNGLPPYVVFAFGSSYTMQTLEKKLRELSPVEPHEAYAAQGVRAQPPIDAICVLGKYVLWNLRDVEGTIDLKNTATGQPAKGWVGLDTAAPLSWTLSWLQLTMPRIVRHSPVLGYYIGKKTLEGAKRLGDTESDKSQSVDGSGPAETTAD